MTTQRPGDGTVPGELKPEATSIRVFPQFKTPYSIPIREGKGGHGGGDIVMLADIFTPDAEPDRVGPGTRPHWRDVCR